MKAALLRAFRLMAVLAALPVLNGCGSDLTSPSAPEGARLSGQFVSNGSASGKVTLSKGDFSNITVTVKEAPEISAVVDEDGFFHLVGLPEGTVTLVFTTEEGGVIGEVVLSDVLPSQEITVLVELNDSGRVILVRQERSGGEDDDSSDGESEDGESEDDDSSDGESEDGESEDIGG